VIATRRERRQLLRDGEIRELQESWSRIEELQIFSRISTSAATAGAVPVVLVHGFGISSSYFIPTAERLAVEFSVYAPDLPGHGRSDTPAEPLDVPALARVLLQWLEVNGLSRVSLVAHSMGCQVAVEAAIARPDVVDRLVLIGPTPDPQGRNTLEQFRRFVMGGAHERAALNYHVVKDYSRMGRRLVPEFRAMRDHPMEHRLPLVRQPVLLLRGDRDPMAPQPWVEAAARLLPHSEVAVIVGWGHAVQFSAPEDVVAAISDFLRPGRS
jgi:2-hydroxy-6-oxonona-2,4-dienedioate hydrolase